MSERIQRNGWSLEGTDQLRQCAPSLSELRRAKANDYTPVVHLVAMPRENGTALCGRGGCFSVPFGRPGEQGESDCDRCWELAALARAVEEHTKP